MLKKIKLLLVSSVFVGLLIAGTVYYMYGYIYVPRLEKINRENFTEQIKRTAGIYSSIFKNELEAKNDIAVLNYLREVQNLPFINYAYIIDFDGRVVAHPSVSELDKVYEDSDTTEILNDPRDARFMKLSDGSSEYITTIFANDSRLSLRFGISRQQNIADFASLKEEMKNKIIILALSGLIVWALFFLISVTKPLKKLRTAFDSAALGKAGEEVEFKKKNELGECCEAANRLIRRYAGQSAPASGDSAGSKDSLKQALQLTGEKLKQGIIVLDSEQKIVTLNSIAGKLFSIDKDRAKDEPVLSVIDDDKVINLIKSAASDPGSEVKDRINEQIQAKVVSFEKDGEYAGSVIFVSKAV